MRTAHHWQEWLKQGTFPDHPWRTYLQRSALTLKGLSYAPTGAMVAAATTSLPETLGGERNWDYRYTWIRDSTFMLWALYTLGFDWEANDFFYFVADLAEAEEGELQIMYGIGGESRLDEQELDHLSGYGGARPVRIGNGAYRQRQHDVWGAVLDSIYLHTRSRDQLPDRLWPIIKRQVAGALEHWREPDHGIWEVRGEPQHFTSSKLMCWVAADRGARLAQLRDDSEWAERWHAAAREIHADICAHGVDERGVFTQHYGTTTLDASLLLMPLVRFLPAEDPRIVATVLAIAEELTEDGLVLRYRVADTDDGLTGEEGSFTICSFWLVSALCEIGELAARPGAVREAHLPRLRAGAVRRGDRSPHRPPPRQLPPGLHASGPDQRRHARDPCRARRAGSDLGDRYGAAMNAGSTYLRLEVISGNAIGDTIVVDDELVIGRHAEGAGRLSEDEEISRQHARISREATGDYAIEDLGSSNGTFVNGLRIQSPRLLALEDSIEVGATTLLVKAIVRSPSPWWWPTRPSCSRVPVAPAARPLPPLALALEVDFDAREARIALGDGGADHGPPLALKDGDLGGARPRDGIRPRRSNARPRRARDGWTLG